MPVASLARRLLCGLVIVSCVASQAASQAPAQRAALDEPRLVRAADAGAVHDGVVTALAEDAAGFLWVGTSVGLVRYDGYQWRAFPVKEDAAAGAAAAGSRFVRALLPGPGGELWVGFEGEGLARLDTAAQAWTLHRPDAGRPDALRHGTVRALARDRQGILWVGTAGGGLHSLHPGATRFDRPGSVAAGTLPDDRVHALRVDRRGDLWIGTWRGLVRKAATRAGFERVAETGPDRLGGRPVTMLGEGPDGRLWVGTRDGGLMIVDPGSGEGRWIEAAKGDDAAAESTRAGGLVSFVIGPDQEVWIGRDRALDIRDGASGALVQRLRRSPRKPWGLGGHNVVALQRDRSGQVWVGSYGGGLQRHTPSPGLWVRRGEGTEGSAFAEGDLRSLHPMRDGTVWAGTPDGAVLVFDRQLRLLHQILPDARSGLAGGLVGAITEAPDGTRWVGSDSGIYAFDAQRRLRARFDMGNVRTRRLLAAADGSLWAATQDGVHRLPRGGRAFERVSSAQGGTLAGNVNALIQAADGSVFVGANAGLWRAAPGQWQLRPVPPEAGHALRSPVVLGLLLDRAGQLWVDTSRGLHRWRRPTVSAAGPARFEAVAVGAPDEATTFGANLLEDDQGRIWTHQNLLDPRDGTVRRLEQADGVDIGTGWFRAHARLDDGRLLFAGSTGLLVVEPARVGRWTYLPPVVVTDLRVDDQRLPLARLEPRLELPAQARSFSIEYAALDLSQPERNRYRHRLLGFDERWVENSAEMRLVRYANLPPGDYRLQVQGSNRLGDWAPSMLDLAVQVRPAWWQTWWARAAALLIAAAAVWGLVQLRTRMLRSRQAALERAVRERTRELEALSRELQLKSAELELSSLTDPLTGLRNRRFLTQHMTADAAMVARRHGERLRARDDGAPGRALADHHDIVFFLIDLDHFKQVNDRHGHAAGDAVLRQVAERLRLAFRGADVVVRWGGEEFLVAARATTREQAAELAERARQALAERRFGLDDGSALALTASIGFAAYPLAPAWPDALDWTATVDLADAALYVVKRGGRDGWFGLLQADPADATELARASRLSLERWLQEGRLRAQGSRPFVPGAAP